MIEFDVGDRKVRKLSSTVGKWGESSGGVSALFKKPNNLELEKAIGPISYTQKGRS